MLTHLFRTRLGEPPGMVIDCRQIHLIGAGGNGAPMLMRLHKIHTTLRMLGQSGLDVTVWDMDTVSPFNIGRQPFYPADVGKNKARLLLDRLKAFDPAVATWSAQERRFDRDANIQGKALMVITCVDNKAARRAVHDVFFKRESAIYWLDLGNEAETGQIVLGECYHPRRHLRLPVVTELFPQILDASISEDDAPSCSTREAIEKQGLFVNETVVAHAGNMLWEGLYHGRISHPVAYVHTRLQSVQGVGIDPAFYKRMRVKMSRARNPQIADLA